jgi:PhnB protein
MGLSHSRGSRRLQIERGFKTPSAVLSPGLNIATNPVRAAMSQQREGSAKVLSDTPAEVYSTCSIRRADQRLHRLTSIVGANTMPVKPIPDGYHTVTPYLYVRGAATAIEFYKKAFGANELFRMAAPGGKVGHAEMKIGDSPIMLADEHPEMDVLGPQSRGGTTVSIVLYVDNVDALFTQAVAAGGKVTRPVKDQFYGDRSGTLTDPFGHVWTIATHKEDVSPQEMEKRMAAMKQD